MLDRLTIHEAHDKLARKELTSVELTEAVFSRVEKLNSALRAFLHLARETALEQARTADARRAQGEDTPLLGVPLAIKDVICVRGMPATAGSKILQGFVPPYDATAIARLRDLGAVFIGKTNTDEFAMGSSTENSAYGVTHNPWDLERVPGGSSGGSAAAVAADLCLGAFGTDTGGSIRQPAALCSVVGIKACTKANNKRDAREARGTSSISWARCAISKVSISASSLKSLMACSTSNSNSRPSTAARCSVSCVASGSRSMRR